MGVGTSSDAGLTLQGLIEEANRLLAKITEIVTQTVETTTASVGAAMSDLHESALATISNVFTTIDKTLAELKRQDEATAVCVRDKEAELGALRNKVKDRLDECYTKYRKSFDVLEADRVSLHNDAQKVMQEIRNMIQSCMASENALDCFKTNYPVFKRNVNALYKRFKKLLKREVEFSVDSSKNLLECNKKVIDSATKECNKIVEKAKKCCNDAMNKS